MLNVSAYLFTALDGLEERRERLRARAVAAGVRGTIILAAEGINLFLAGDAAAVRGILDVLRSEEAFANLTACRRRPSSGGWMTGWTIKAEKS